MFLAVQKEIYNIDQVVNKSRVIQPSTSQMPVKTNSVPVISIMFSVVELGKQRTEKLKALLKSP
jgi:hypothetical protein